MVKPYLDTVPGQATSAIEKVTREKPIDWKSPIQLGHECRLSSGGLSRKTTTRLPASADG